MKIEIVGLFKIIVGFEKIAYPPQTAILLIYGYFKDKMIDIWYCRIESELKILIEMEKYHMFHLKIKSDWHSRWNRKSN